MSNQLLAQPFVVGKVDAAALGNRAKIEVQGSKRLGDCMFD